MLPNKEQLQGLNYVVQVELSPSDVVSTRSDLALNSRWAIICRRVQSARCSTCRASCLYGHICVTFPLQPHQTRCWLWKHCLETPWHRMRTPHFYIKISCPLVGPPSLPCCWCCRSVRLRLLSAEEGLRLTCRPSTCPLKCWWEASSRDEIVIWEEKCVFSLNQVASVLCRQFKILLEAS